MPNKQKIRYDEVDRTFYNAIKNLFENLAKEATNDV